jgi:N-formylglutamate amidohydrolase
LTRPRRVAWLVVCAAASASAPPEAPPTSRLVATQEGTLPIILSAPHGGTKEISGVPPRKGEGLAKDGKGFVASRDAGTEELTYALAEAIEKRTGKKPYFVVAKFHRKYLDANRPAEVGLEHAKARPVYEAYHQTLAHYCREVKKTYGRGLLLDVHGHGSEKDTIFRGTQIGKAVTLLRQRFGESAHTGPKSFFALLAAHGCTVFPGEGTAKERAGYTGGHIVRTYGSHEAHGIDAMQLEFGGSYRTKAKVKETAEKVARAVEAYAKLYLRD